MRCRLRKKFIFSFLPFPETWMQAVFLSFEVIKQSLVLHDGKTTSPKLFDAFFRFNPNNPCCPPPYWCLLMCSARQSESLRRHLADSWGRVVRWASEDILYGSVAVRYSFGVHKPAYFVANPSTLMDLRFLPPAHCAGSDVVKFA